MEPPPEKPVPVIGMLIWQSLSKIATKSKYNDGSDLSQDKRPWYVNKACYYSCPNDRSAVINRLAPEEDGTRHVINDFIWEMSIRTISTKVEDVSHKNL